jgi:acetylglutamate kinase
MKPREKEKRRREQWETRTRVKTMTTVLKLGGELLEDAAAIESVAPAIVRLAARGALVVVHGGGRAIDAELRARGDEPHFVDGLRVTDAAALDAVVCVLAGRNNTALVAAIAAAGGRAVGLTGADGFIGRATLTGAFTAVSGEQVDLGLVGRPDDPDVSLLRDLLTLGYIPVIASVGITASGDLLNVNADAFAGELAAALGARRLIVAGATNGVLDPDGLTIAHLTPDDIARMTATGAVHSGMIAKLAACRRALDGGVNQVAIVSGRGVSDFEAAEGTRIGLAASTSGRAS